jgi:hypothetical protein
MGSLVVCSISRSGRRYTSLFFTKVLGATGLAEQVPRPRLIGEAIARAKHLRRTRPQVWIEEVGKPGVSKPRRCPKDGLICALPACVTNDICIERFEEEGL